MRFSVQFGALGASLMAGGAVGILGPTNVHALVAAHALQMISRLEIGSVRMHAVNFFCMAASAFGRLGREWTPMVACGT